MPVHSLEELIAYNTAHAAEEMPHFQQELFIASQARGPLTDQTYLTPSPEILGSRDRKASMKSWIAWSWRLSSPQLAVLRGPRRQRWSWVH